ncbi:hypothetical protein FQZ97_1149540 [compost metagenome]
MTSPQGVANGRSQVWEAQQARRLGADAASSICTPVSVPNPDHGDSKMVAPLFLPVERNFRCFRSRVLGLDYPFSGNNAHARARLDRLAVRCQRRLRVPVLRCI